ncbi:hypothetical protein AVEN_53456-1 [Araneus ventricosus]|uniref:Uncharacterized protein n=1 Tax=Araneus ventricosus TaxID=182803 RepID=A0A4Y2AB29_ARAVE|nr:hypothetical protein AVEN_53456-1 [Araneus ventricosus]
MGRACPLSNLKRERENCFVVPAASAVGPDGATQQSATSQRPSGKANRLHALRKMQPPDVAFCLTSPHGGDEVCERSSSRVAPQVKSRMGSSVRELA